MAEDNCSVYFTAQRLNVVKLVWILVVCMVALLLSSTSLHRRVLGLRRRQAVTPSRGQQIKRSRTLPVMAFQSKPPLTSSLRHPSIGGSLRSSGQSSLLATRINEKKVELENLKQLRDLSGDLATQMQALEQKLATLSDGTEGMLVLPVK